MHAIYYWYYYLYELNILFNYINYFAITSSLYKYYYFPLTVILIPYLNIYWPRPNEVARSLRRQPKKKVIPKDHPIGKASQRRVVVISYYPNCSFIGYRSTSSSSV